METIILTSVQSGTHVLEFAMIYLPVDFDAKLEKLAFERQLYSIRNGEQSPFLQQMPEGFIAEIMCDEGIYGDLAKKLWKGTPSVVVARPLEIVSARAYGNAVGDNGAFINFVGKNHFQVVAFDHEMTAYFSAPIRYTTDEKYLN